MPGERETSIGPRRFGIYKRTGRYHAVLYAHTTVEIGPFTFNFSRWHDLDNPSRRDYAAEFGYWNGNDEDILNPHASWAFHTGRG